MSIRELQKFLPYELFEEFSCNKKDPESDYYFYGVTIDVVVPIYLDNFDGYKLLLELIYTVDWLVAINENISDYSYNDKVKKIDLNRIDYDYFKRKKIEKREEIDLYINVSYQKFRAYEYNTNLFKAREAYLWGTEVQNYLKQKIQKEFIELNKINKSNKDIISVLSPDFYKELLHLEEIHRQHPSKVFATMKEIIERNADEILLPYQTYQALLDKLNKFSYTTLINGKINIADVNEIKTILEKLKSSPLEKMLNSIYKSILDYAKDSNKIGICKKCKQYFIAKKGKKYCSTASESQDCGKSARNQKAYIKRKHPLLKNKKTA